MRKPILPSRVDDTMYYAAYARVSSKDQAKGISLILQLQLIDQWIKRQSGTWVCVGEFQDDETGDNVDRDEMSIIVELAKQRRINAVVVSDRDRFARDQGTAILLEKEFQKQDIRLFSAKQNEFSYGMKNIIVEAVERAWPEENKQKLLENMREKRYAYVNNGAVPAGGMSMYGYTKIGKQASMRYEVNEDEAEIVRLIFDLYIQRYSFDQIADIISEMNVPQPSNKKLRDGSRERNNRYAKVGWTKNVVRRIIKNADIYKGVFTAYKYAIRKDAPEQRTINIPAILDHDTYTKVVYVSEQTRSFFSRRNEARLFLLTGRFACKCGYAYSGTTTTQKKKSGAINQFHYYRCNSFVNKDKKEYCDIHYIPADKVEVVLWDFLTSILLDPRTAIARYKQQQNDTQRIVDNAIAHVESIDEVLAELNAEREQVLKLFTKRLISEDRLDSDIAVIDRQTDKLHVERDKWMNVVESNTITDSQIQQLEAISHAIKNELEDIDLDRKLWILDRLRIKVTAAKEDGVIALYVSILGALPERLSLLQNDSFARKRNTFSNCLIFRVPIP